MLQPYIPLGPQRKATLQEILTRFEETSTYTYPLDNHHSIILSRDERESGNLRRYKNSPFPLLQNIEQFCTSLGGWNSELLEYGIRTRAKGPELSTNHRSGSQISLIHHSNLSSKGNWYLKLQYKRLSKYRSERKILEYWDLSWTLMLKSWSYRIASLNSWQSRWYKTLSLTELEKLWKGLHRILNLTETKTNVYNVWIESPKGKYRQLGVPNKPWRLYLHMLNQFISYIYDPHLPSSTYDGFLYNRGCKTWWEKLIWSPLLSTYSWIMEVDFSSGFPNLNLHFVAKALNSDGLLPPNLINLILTHLKSPLITAPTFPTFESFVEHHENLLWRKSDRSVHMGLGISPILYVITLHWGLQQLNLLNPYFTYKAYADDLTFFFQPRWIWNYFTRDWLTSLTFFASILTSQNPLLHSLNQEPLLQKIGLRFCLTKSGWVRIQWIWIRSLKSLGLTLYCKDNLWTQITKLYYHLPLTLHLKGSTRGRGMNPKTGKRSTPPSNQPLEWWTSDKTRVLDLTTLISHYQTYFGLLQSKLYSPLPLPKGILGNLRSNLKPLSLLDQLLKWKANHLLPHHEKLNLYNTSSKLNELMLNLTSPISQPNSLLNNHLRLWKLKPKWPSIKRWIKEYKEIKNPLNPLDENQPNYFIKYSELKLTKAQIQNYRELYKLEQENLNLP